MAGLECVVRPMVLPNIRPASTRVLPLQDDPGKGIAVISGGGGGPIDLPYSFSVSYSSSAAYTESVRQFSVDRIYQKDEKGNVNKDNFVDTERMTRVKVERWDGVIRIDFEHNIPALDNVETTSVDNTRIAE
jgi:hypothetical protein